MDQNPLAGFDLAVSKQALPCGLSGKRDGGGVHMVEIGGLGRDGILGHHDFLRVTAAVNAHDPEHLVADLKFFRARAAPLHDAGNVAPQDVGKPSSFTAGYLPERILKSTGLTLAARTLTRISVASGIDGSTSSTSRVSMPPNL
jgi:hypothetical protein